MAAQSKKSILGSQYGQSGDVAAQIAQDTSLPAAGFQDPPPGIRTGIAQLDEVKFDVYKSGENEGKPYFSATAIIVEPFTQTYTPTSQGKEVGEPTVVQTSGMQTRIQVPIYNVTTKTGKNMGKVTSWQEGAQKAAQHMRALGGDTSKVKKVEDLETVAETLTRIARNQQTPIFLRFATSVRKAQNVGDADGTWQNWNGTQGLEDYAPPDGAVVGGTDDQSGTSNDPDDVTNLNVDTLLDSAQAEDADAQNELLRRAAEVSGKTAEDIEAIDGIDWDGVVAIINGADPDAGSGADFADDVPPEPMEKGDHINYKPMVKGIGGKMKKAAKPIECNIESINATKGTCTLKNTVDGKSLYKDVPLSDLEEIV